MFKKLTIITTLVGLTFGLAACSNGRYDSQYSETRPGLYQSNETATDKYGTRVERNISTEIENDSYGNRKATVTSKTTRDPKGLFNKTITTQTKESTRSRN